MCLWPQIRVEANEALFAGEAIAAVETAEIVTHQSVELLEKTIMDLADKEIQVKIVSPGQRSRSV